jgi:ketosteroid isomerase-like protein
LIVSENLDLVRSICAAWERGDWSTFNWADPDIEYVMRDGPSPGRWTGLAGMAEGGRGNLDAWEGMRFEAETYREIDDERLLVLGRYRGRGKASGLELDQMRAGGASLFHVHDGKVTRLAFYWDREHALSDLGLAPEADSQR